MYKILIAEDEIPLQKILAERFSTASFEVEVAGNGREAIAKARTFLPDFILMDIMMPEMDGVTAVRHLKELPGLQKIPIAMLTALSEAVPESLHPEADLENNVVAYFRKDTERIEELVDKVKVYLTSNQSGEYGKIIPRE